MIEQLGADAWYHGPSFVRRWGFVAGKVVLGSRGGKTQRPVVTATPHLFINTTLDIYCTMRRYFYKFERGSLIVLGSHLGDNVTRKLFRTCYMAQTHHFHVHSTTYLQIVHLQRSKRCLALFRISTGTTPRSTRHHLSST